MNANSLPPSGRLLFDELQTRPNLRLQVGEQVIDVGALRVVTRPELPRLSGKSLAVLIELVRHCGATVTRGQLLERVWAERVITPDVLTQAIAELRRAFLDDVKSPRYIETVPRVGYRLLAPVNLLHSEATLPMDDTVPADASNDDVPSTIATPLSITATRVKEDEKKITLYPLWALLTAIVAVVIVASTIGH
jgi:DNA-binding winged helix-turn-helix (wHTH) protein